MTPLRAARIIHAMLHRETRVNVLISLGHTLSHFYILVFPPLFIVWQHEFGISFAALGLAPVVMSIMSATLQTPLGFLVDRFGARPFLIGGTLFMSLAISGMAFCTEYWQILALATVSGIGNAVFHPADYSILAGSISKERIGRAFALHSFTGNVGFAVAPPVVAGLMLFMGWRGALLTVGLLGLPVVAAVIWQSAILQDEVKRERTAHRLTVRQLLLDRTIVMFFMFYLLGSMAGSGVQAWLITILHQVKGIEIALASTALTAYMIGSSVGVLFGGWATDHAKSKRHLSTFVAALTSISALTTLLVGVTPVSGLVAIGMMFCSGLCLGGSRTPRDVMLKDAAPPGEIGKVFGFVSASLGLGSALVPVPFGYLIDHGHPDMVLILAACLMVASLFFMGSARASFRHRQAATAPAE
ncbi:MAG TPA: MFS transporter [Stellaceae bacterium]|nr:MFS transporter [Stellaceae bacterium]